MQPDDAIAKIAKKQHSAFTIAQAQTAGFSYDAIRRRCRSGIWASPRRGVLVVGGSPPTAKQRIIVVALSLHAVTSHITAGALLGLLEGEGGPIHVTLPYGKHRAARDGVRVHQADLAKTDVRRVDNIPVTCPNRTLIDITSIGRRRQTEAALDNAIQHGLTTIPKLREYIDERRLGGNRGMVYLRLLLDDRQEGAMHKALERMFRRKLEATDLPRPKRQFPVGPYKVDFAWPAKKVVVELDGLGGHFSAEGARRDKKRDRVIIRAGLKPLHYSWDDIDLDWPAVEADLRDMLK